jgi:hypothetical protein
MATTYLSASFNSPLHKAVGARNAFDASGYAGLFLQTTACFFRFAFPLYYVHLLNQMFCPVFTDV